MNHSACPSQLTHRNFKSVWLESKIILRNELNPWAKTKQNTNTLCLSPPLNPQPTLLEGSTLPPRHLLLPLVWQSVSRSPYTSFGVTWKWRVKKISKEAHTQAHMHTLKWVRTWVKSELRLVLDSLLWVSSHIWILGVCNLSCSRVAKTHIFVTWVWVAGPKFHLWTVHIFNKPTLCNFFRHKSIYPNLTCRYPLNLSEGEINGASYLIWTVCWKFRQMFTKNISSNAWVASNTVLSAISVNLWILRQM